MKKLDCSTIRLSGNTSGNITEKTTVREASLYLPTRIEIPYQILDKLIRVAAKCTERFASDLIIDIDSMRADIAERLSQDEPISLEYYFGFRDSGIDHRAFIETRNKFEYQTEYIQVWRLTCDKISNEFSTIELEFTLSRLNDYVDERNFKEDN